MKNLAKKFVLVFILMNLALTIQMAVAQASVKANFPMIPGYLKADSTSPSNGTDTQSNGTDTQSNGTDTQSNGTADQPSIQDPTVQPPSQNEAILSPIEYLKTIGSGTHLPNYTNTGLHPDAGADIQPGVATVSSPIYFALDLFRYAVSTIAFVVIIIAAIKLVTTSNEEEAAKSKKSLLIGIIGLLIIQLADVAVKKMFFGEQGQAFQDLGTAQLFAKDAVSQIRGIIGFTEIFLGAAAVLTIVLKGFTLITSGGEEEAQTTAKKHILYALVGLAIVGLSEVVVRGFIFPDAGSRLPDVDVGKRLIVSIVNYLSGFIAILAFVSLFYGGYKYVVSGGNEEVNEKVKKHFQSAVIALLISMSAFAIVNTLVKFDTPKNPDSTVKTSQTQPQ